MQLPLPKEGSIQPNFSAIFSHFLFHCSLSRTTFSEFGVRHGRDPRFKSIEKMKDREAIFTEFMTALRKREKEDSKTRGEKVHWRGAPLSLFIMSVVQGWNPCDTAPPCVRLCSPDEDRLL